MWVARAEYEDGTEIEQYFPYLEDDDYMKERKRQHELEEWLVSQHEGCIWFTVNYEED